MQTTMVPEQVETQKSQAEVQVSRPKDKDVIFSIGSALENFILGVFLFLFRNIVSNFGFDILGEDFGGGGGTLGGGDIDEFKFGNGSSSGCHGGLWWLIMDEEDDEVIVNIWREFIGIESENDIFAFDAVGKKLMAGAADTVKKVSLELGGNAPCIIFDDADLEVALKGSLYHIWQPNSVTLDKLASVQIEY
ncbi:succinate-semialdehyde dehydrogenase, mitochondrial-like protein [Tanacetum coccineum]